ncbi:MAG: JAB domain-containing protein [Flavisolibacter sp.]|nr:JAB domain-containing protein [Flavisolibacter sp.]
METMIENVRTFNAPEIHLCYNREFNPSELPVLNKSDDVYALLLEIWDRDQLQIREDFKVILLNHNSRVLGIYNHTSGGIAGTVCDVRLIMASALKSLATGIVLAHNHPSGNLEPSKADRFLTAKLADACRLFDISLLDHFIISKESYYSFSKNGEL